MAEIVGRFAWSKIHDVVGIGGGGTVQAGLFAHPVCNGVIGAGAVAADAQSANDLAARVERDAASERVMALVSKL